MSCTYRPANSQNKNLDSRCCQSGCPDCPFGFKLDPQLPQELKESRDAHRPAEKDEFMTLNEELLESYMADKELNPDS